MSRSRPRTERDRDTGRERQTDRQLDKKATEREIGSADGSKYTKIFFSLALSQLYWLFEEMREISYRNVCARYMYACLYHTHIWKKKCFVFILIASQIKLNNGCWIWHLLLFYTCDNISSIIFVHVWACNYISRVYYGKCTRSLSLVHAHPSCANLYRCHSYYVCTNFVLCNR